MTTLSHQMRAFLAQGVATDGLMASDFEAWVSGWLAQVEQLERRLQALEVWADSCPMPEDET